MRQEDSKRTNTEEIIGHHQHEINKRQTNNTSKPKRPIYLENINSSCTFFYADYPDDNGKRSNYSSTGIKKNTIKSKQHLCENSNSFCTFFHPDRSDVGLKKVNYGSNVSNEVMQKTIKAEEVSSSCKDLQLLGQLEAAFKQKIEEIKTETNRSSKDHDEKIAKIMNGEKELSQLLKQSMEVQKELKTQNENQSMRIDQLEQKVVMLANPPQISPFLTRSNIKDKTKNGTSHSNNGQVSKALTPPSSCQELAMLEHYLDGIYLVKNKGTKKIQTVFCKFSDDNKGRMNLF
jgi:hypothetical protein